MPNHALPRQPLAAQRVRIELTDAPPPRAVTLERIDDDHANAKAAWLAMDRPEYLDDAQLEKLQDASRLVAGPLPCAYEGQTIRLDVELPPLVLAAVTMRS